MVIATVDELLSVAAGLTNVVLVPHSNAGYRASYLAEQLGTVPTVYVDAALPPADASETVLAPPAFLDFLAGLADADGLLPPWTQWWERRRRAVPRRNHPAPGRGRAAAVDLDYFRQSVPVALDWAEKPCAYVAFGSTYADR